MTKTKLQLRAEAVERLRECRYHTLADYVRAMLGWGHEPHFEDSRDALIDLLTDDCGPCYSCAKLAELVAENNALRAANDMKATESDVRTLGVDANDASVDTREKLEADVRQILHSAYMFAWMHGNENRRGGSFKNLHREFYNLLDRQEEITERECEWHWMEIVGASANANVELKRQIDERQARVDELTEQLETAHAKNRALKAHIAKMQEGRHGWHVKYPELEKKNAELEAERDELQSAYDDLVGKCAELCALCGFNMVDASGEVVG